MSTPWQDEQQRHYDRLLFSDAAKSMAMLAVLGFVAIVGLGIALGVVGAVAVHVYRWIT